jgi:hypothetical protein
MSDHTSPTGLPCSVRSARQPHSVSRLRATSASTKETKVQNPNTNSSQTPSDIGDQGLMIGVNTSLAMIMCQKRSGRPRSTRSSRPATEISGKASRWAVRATGERPRPFASSSAAVA